MNWNWLNSFNESTNWDDLFNELNKIENENLFGAKYFESWGNDETKYLKAISDRVLFLCKPLILNLKEFESQNIELRKSLRHSTWINLGLVFVSIISTLAAVVSAAQPYL